MTPIEKYVRYGGIWGYRIDSLAVSYGTGRRELATPEYACSDKLFEDTQGLLSQNHQTKETCKDEEWQERKN